LESVTLYLQEKADLIASNDDKVRRLRLILDLSLISSPEMVFMMAKNEVISKDKAIDSLLELKKIGWFSPNVIDIIVEEVRKVGVRLSKDVLDYIEKEAMRENVDRSVMIRRLMERGIAEFRKERAAELYMGGKPPSAARQRWQASQYQKWLSILSIRGVNQAIHWRILGEE